MYCQEWNKNKLVNPFTNKRIKKDSNIYKIYEKFCKSLDTNCNSLTNNPNVNPLTLRKLSDRSKIKLLLRQICGYEEKKSKEKIKQTSIQPAPSMHIVPFSPKQLPFKEHQRKILEYIKQNDDLDGLLIFHSIGSGKTFLSLGIAKTILKKYPHQKVFFVSPTSLVDNFKKEMTKWSIHFGSNVEFLSHKTFLNNFIRQGEEYTRNCLLIIDEAHKFGTLGKYTTLLLKATSVASQTFLLTATPVSNNIYEIIPLYCIITKTQDVLMETIEQFKEYLDAANYNALYKLFKNRVAFFNATDREFYPKEAYHKITFEMTDVYYKLYKDVEDNQNKNIFSSGNLSVFYNGIRRGVNYLGNTITSPKVVWSVNKIKHDVKLNHKVLFYSNWLAAGSRLVMKELDALGIPYSFLNGSLSKTQRRDAIDSYNKGYTRVLFISSSGAEGIDLKNTRTVILLESHWNSEKTRQVVGRAIRYKSHQELSPNQRKVDVYQLVLQKPKDTKDKLPSADDYLLQMSERKFTIIDNFYKILEKSSI